MHSVSLKNILLEMLTLRGTYVHSVEIEDYARTLGFKSSNSGRRMRELYNEGKVQREYRLHDGVKIVWYKSKELPPPKPVLSQYAKEHVNQMSLI